MARQRKMTEMVDAELLLKALYGSSEGGHHEAGVEHQAVQAVVSGQETVGKGRHALQICEVEMVGLECAVLGALANPLNRSLSFLHVSTRKGHVCSCLGKKTCGFVSNAGVGPGDHHTEPFR